MPVSGSKACRSSGRVVATLAMQFDQFSLFNAKLTISTWISRLAQGKIGVLIELEICLVFENRLRKSLHIGVIILKYMSIDVFLIVIFYKWHLFFFFYVFALQLFIGNGNIISARDP
jgi:hypothetical protein